jgi:hypothetical protein
MRVPGCQLDTSEAPMPRRRGHGPKIAEAVRTLRAEGRLPHALRPIEREKRITERLREAGYQGAELPSRHAIARFFDGASA